MMWHQQSTQVLKGRDEDVGGGNHNQTAEMNKPKLCAVISARTDQQRHFWN